MENKPEKIIIHHSLTRDGKVVDYDAIKRYHTQVLGWKDIGYHYVIELVGNEYKILKGRDEKIVGAHTKGENLNSIGICLVGNFDKITPPEGQLEKLYELIEDIYNRYGKLPIFGHNDFSSKTCPGTKFPMKKVLDKMSNYIDNRNTVDLSQWAKDAYEWVKKEGISDGIDPKGVLTREQFWTMLYRYFKIYGK